MASEVESTATVSTSVSDDSPSPPSIEFRNINFTVGSCLHRNGKKQILKNISGQFKAGELTVIVGQSGAGKSSIMDILSAYTKPTSGEIYVDGEIRNDKEFRRKSCYILQDDKVQDQLTIKESLYIAAELKLGHHIKKHQRDERVMKIIQWLGLKDAENTRAVNLSGGQRKRLAIGLELISNPPFIFLDEPTSGLDSSTSTQIVNILHLIARAGRTVVVTIHQPSASLLKKVDRVYAMSVGKCVYMGAVDMLLPFFQQVDKPCPSNYTPVDYLIEISSEENTYEKLVFNSQNGVNPQWNDRPPSIGLDLIEGTRRCDCEDISSLKWLSASKDAFTTRHTYATTRWRQFLTLTKRSLLCQWRSRSTTFSFIGIHIIMACLVITLFWNIRDDAGRVMDLFGFLYYCLMFLMYTAFSAVSISFPEQLPVVRREHFNRWYSTSAYYWSTLVSSLPIQTLCTIIFANIVFWPIIVTRDPHRFFIFTSTLLMVSYVALCIGLLNGTMFSVKNGVIFGPFFIMPFTIFSGYFLHFVDTSKYFSWFFHLSFLKHGLVGLVVAIFGMDRHKFKDCDKIYCHYREPKLFLKDIGMLDETLDVAVKALLAISVVVISVSYIILRIRLKCKW